MGFASIALAWKAPEVNPVNGKALSIPALNPINKYGRVFFFSWFGFLVAFWSWYAFPPLLSDIIAKDLHLTKEQVSNSNIIALVATLLVRLVAGTCCDVFGPRWTFAGCLLIGAIPTFLAGTAFNASELYALRFFIGILGGSFVPCQVWTTGFYDTKVVGTANSLTAGLGNAGGGITYFIMPAVYNSLVRDGLKPHTAWRVAFVVPGIVITTVAIALLILCPDTPNGKWADRNKRPVQDAPAQDNIVDIPSHKADESQDSGISTPPDAANEKKHSMDSTGASPPSEGVGESSELTQAQAAIIQKPSFKEIAKLCTSPQTWVLGACYFCSFGAELAINSILGTYYQRQFKHDHLSLQNSSNWAAMFGLMNAVFRPLGGVVSDYLYRYTKSLWAKKIVLHVYSIIAGAFLLAIGLTNPTRLTELVCLVGVGFAFFLEGANGMVFALVPHVHPHANGIVSGFTGASGNLGGVIFAIVFRYNYTNYGKSIWIIGTMMIAINLAVCWIKPVPKGQVLIR